MPRKLRIALALLCFVSITLLFLDFSGTLHVYLGWLAKIQFIPALLALNIAVVAALVVLTLFFGRLYCSIICPLGVFQDGVNRLGSIGKKRKHRFSYMPERKWLRFSVLGVFVLALVAGFTSFATLLEPYSAYGRMAQSLLSPLWQWGNNFLAYLAERADSYAFYRTEVWLRSLSVLLTALITLGVIFVLAWKKGRIYCNTICPVGTLLGLVSRFSFFRPLIDTSKCNGCGQCLRHCKSSCIDGQNHYIDQSRCVVCLDCLETCRQGAISYRWRFGKKAATEEKTKAPDGTRRGFLAGLGLLLGSSALRAQTKTVDGGLAVILDKKIPERATPIVPPGAQSLKHFRQHCTGCQLCVSACPNGVLRPSSELQSLMQPVSSYERGYCRPECVKCSSVCPTGAIQKISPADKSSIQIGHAVWVAENCLPFTEGVRCGNCAKHCPVGAIQMLPSQKDNPASPWRPIINEERCIGCGACENLCPARPFGAIYVEGHSVHKTL